MTISATFDKVCDMETPLETVANILTGLSLIAEKIGDQDISAVVQRLSWLAKDQCTVLETMRCDLFELTTPHGAKAVRP